MIVAVAASIALLPLKGITKAFPADQFAKYGREVIASIRESMYLPESHLYAQNGTTKGPGRVSDNWSTGVMLSALDAAAAYDDKYKPVLREYADAVAAYWNPDPPVGGYGVLPNQTKPDRYYDDNEWMVLAMFEAGVVLDDSKYVTAASNSLKFVLSGEDGRLGGGLYWHEQEKTSKNTCSNAPAIVDILFVNNPGKDSDLLKHAVAIYDWTYKTLHDTETGLFWDNIKLDGTVQKSFWTYNTALMIDASALLFKATGNEMYGERARRLEEQAIQHWITPDGRIADDASFAHKLLEAMLVRVLVAPTHLEKIGAAKVAQKALDELHNHIRDKNGHYPKRWDQPQNTPLENWTLLNQASAARAYFLMALYLKENQTPLGR